MNLESLISVNDEIPCVKPISLTMRYFEKAKRIFFSSSMVNRRFAEYTTGKNLLTRYGHSKTIRMISSIGLSDSPVPWYTYPAIEYLESLDLTQMSAFEFGSGNSTLWWAAKVRSLASVESDSKWHQKISSELIHCKNVDYILNSDFGDYSEDARALESDIVIIDGDFRSKCARFLVENPNSCTILIFDNSDWYPSTIEYLSEHLQEYIRVDFSGFGPINSYSWTTSIFISKSAPQLNFNKLIGSRAGIISKSGEDY